MEKVIPSFQYEQIFTPKPKSLNEEEERKY
jgi:hypothetical protein